MSNCTYDHLDKTTGEEFVDPFLNRQGKRKGLPDDLRFACAIEMATSIDNFVEVSFYRRTRTRDELWAVIYYGTVEDTDGKWITELPSNNMSRPRLGDPYVLGIGCTVSAPKQSEELSACLSLLTRAFRGSTGFSDPLRMLVPGMVDETAFHGLVQRIKQEMDDNKRKAHEENTEIVKVAQELGLHPEPSGAGPDEWQASCPKGRHQLVIQATKNLFYCGYCRRGGGPDELRAFVKES